MEARHLLRRQIYILTKILEKNVRRTTAAIVGPLRLFLQKNLVLDV